MANHWYKRDGSPLHHVRGLNGELRKTTLRDARKYGLVPSVTTILSIIDKPFLTKWQVDQGILSALTAGRRDGESDTDFLTRLYQDSRKQVYDAGIIGDKIHDACFNHLVGKPVDTEFLPHAIAAAETIQTNFPDVDDWVAEQPFAHPLGFGGRVDLHSKKYGIVIDYKGKDFTPEDVKVLKYDQHYQLGGYQIGLNLPVNWGMNIFISRNFPGYAVGQAWNKDKMEHGRRVFLAALELWKAIKNYDPSFSASG